MFKKSSVKACLAAILLLSLAMGYRASRSTSEPGRAPLHSRQIPEEQRSVQPRAWQSTVTDDLAGHDGMTAPQDPGDELAPEIAADDSAAEDIAPDLSHIPGADPAELCSLLANTMRSGESPETTAIFNELVKRGDDSIAAVERLLNSGNSTTEAFAMRILVGIGTARSLGAAIPKIIVEPHGDSHKKLVKVFSNVRSSITAGIIADMMTLERKDERQRTLKEILAAMEGGEVVEELMKRIDQDTAPVLAENCLDAISSMSKPSNVEALGKILDSDNREPVQAAVAAALAKIGDGTACQALADHGTTNLSCRNALEQVRSPYAQKTLMEIASSSVDEKVRSAAVKALRRFDTADIAAFLEAIKDREQGGQVLETVRDALSEDETKR